MDDVQRKRNLTIVGLPRIAPDGTMEPFPLTPYADVQVYTPSHSRERHEPTPIMFVPPRRETPYERETRRALRESVRRRQGPSWRIMLLAATLVIWGTAAVLWAAF